MFGMTLGQTAVVMMFWAFTLASVGGVVWLLMAGELYSAILGLFGAALTAQAALIVSRHDDGVAVRSRVPSARSWAVGLVILVMLAAVAVATREPRRLIIFGPVFGLMLLAFLWRFVSERKRSKR